MKSLLAWGLLAPFLLSCSAEKPVDYSSKKLSPVPAPTTIEAREASQASEGTTKAAPVFVPEAAPEVTPALVDAGKTVYTANCLQCHNRNPTENGSIGPAQANTPWEVFKVKVVTGRYPEALPPGYTPARKTKAMRKFPDLEKDLPALWAYVQSFK